jgi:magnesium transporter
LIQVLDLLETYREFLTSLTETHLSTASQRLNDIVKTLTIISTIFVPLTFFAGVYGMNMPIPENESKWSYPLFWGFCLVVVAGMLYMFRRRGWL